MYVKKLFYLISKVFKLIFTNILILLVGIIFIELIFGKWFIKKNYGSLIIPKYSITKINQPYYDDSGTYVSSWDKNGFRANTYDLNEIDILIIGGSTTAQRFIDDTHIWTKVFEKKINEKKQLKVLNAGIGGQTVYGHNNMFDLWFLKHADLSPKYILIYLGINDAIKLNENINKNITNIKNSNYSRIKSDILQSKVRNKRVVQYIKNHSAIHLLYLIIRSVYISNKHEINNPSDTKFIDSYPIHFDRHSLFIDQYLVSMPVEISEKKKKIIKSYLPDYEKNITSIINYSKNLSAEPIFITNIMPADFYASNYSKKLSIYLEYLNNSTINICKKFNITCFDLRDKIYFNTYRDFYDPIHNTPSGSEKLGSFVSYLFLKHIERN